MFLFHGREGGGTLPKTKKTEGLEGPHNKYIHILKDYDFAVSEYIYINEFLLPSFTVTCGETKSLV